MGDTQISWLNELREWHVMSCHVPSTTLLGDVVCRLFLSHVVTRQKRMLTWRHIRHVGEMSRNVTCCWHCCRPSCYGDRQQFLLRCTWSRVIWLISDIRLFGSIWIVLLFTINCHFGRDSRCVNIFGAFGCSLFALDNRVSFFWRCESFWLFSVLPLLTFDSLTTSLLTTSEFSSSSELLSKMFVWLW